MQRDPAAAGIEIDEAGLASAFCELQDVAVERRHVLACTWLQEYANRERFRPLPPTESLHMPEKVFQKIDGKLVPKPGNKREQGRRYGGIENDPITGNSRVVEFTPQEEAERDAEEAKWESERPKREAEKKERLEKAEAYRVSLKYELRLVAFLDILGWRGAVERSVNDPELIQTLGLGLSSLRDQAGMVDWMKAHAGDTEWPGDPQMTQFSDCIVISARTDYSGYGHILTALGTITASLLWKGLFVRGAVVRGLMYHKGAVAYGPALTAAYQREQDAKYPRVVLDENLAAEFGQGIRYQRKDGSPLGCAKTWRKASDGVTFFDFLQPLNAKTFEEPYSGFARTLESFRAPIERGLHQHFEDTVYEKYLWLASYFNEVCSEYAASNVLPIPIIARR